MTDNFEKNVFGSRGCVLVDSGPIPAGDYFAVQCLTDVTLTSLTIANAPLTATAAAPSVSTLTNKVIPAGSTIYTKFLFPTTAVWNITGKAVFYRTFNQNV